VAEPPPPLPHPASPNATTDSTAIAQRNRDRFILFPFRLIHSAGFELVDDQLALDFD
jgi:hypothetical protein